MLPAEGTDGIHDPIHLPQGHTVHPLVQIIKGGFHGMGVCVIALVVVAEEHLQDGIGIAAVVGGLYHMVFQDLDILAHSYHRPALLPASFCRPGENYSGTAVTQP